MIKIIELSDFAEENFDLGDEVICCVIAYNHMLQCIYSNAIHTHLLLVDC